jgi:hypothetical protein
MNKVLKACFVVGAGLVITACGGGGDDGVTPSAAAPTATSSTGPIAIAPTVVTKYTEADVRKTAQMAALAKTLDGTVLMERLAVLPGYVYGASIDAGGSRTLPTMSCTNLGGRSGTISSNFTKSATRSGLAVGDTLTLFLNNCDFGPDIGIYNGTARMTARATISLNSLTTFTIALRADLTELTSIADGMTSKFNGSVDMDVEISPISATFKFAVPADQTMVAEVGSSTGSYKLAHAQGTTFTRKQFLSVTTDKLDGAITMTVNGDSRSVTVETPTALSGSLSTDSFALFVPTAGEFNIKSGDLSTSVSVNGNTVTVRGDSDGNGSLDLSFSTSWRALMGL